MLWSHPRVTASRHPSERPPSRLDQAFDPIIVDQLHGALPTLREHLDIRRVRLAANHQPSSSLRRTELHIRPAVRSDEAQQDGFWIWLAPPHDLGILRKHKEAGANPAALVPDLDRKSTRLNSSHKQISYALF